MQECTCHLHNYEQKILTHGLNCILPQFIYWNLNPQCDAIWRWGSWEVIRVEWVHEGGAFVMAIVPLREETSHPPSLSHMIFHCVCMCMCVWMCDFLCVSLPPYHMITRWEGCCVQTRNGISKQLDFQSSIVWEINSGCPQYFFMEVYADYNIPGHRNSWTSESSLLNVLYYLTQNIMS